MDQATQVRMEEIDAEIDKLKAELPTIKGRETEVYTRIVGYYRSVKNWNKGKRAEFNNRMPFAVPENFSARGLKSGRQMPTESL